VEAHLGARSVASPVPGPHAGSRHRRFVLRHLPGRRDRAARAFVGIPLEDVRDHAGRPVAVAIYPDVFSPVFRLANPGSKQHDHYSLHA
jgi:hypothetical protein